MQEVISVPILRFKFSDIFQKNSDGSLTPKVVISVNGITFGPGILIREGIAVGGVDLFKYQKNDVAIEKNEGINKIIGFYN